MLVHREYKAEATPNPRLCPGAALKVLKKARPMALENEFS